MKTIYKFLLILLTVALSTFGILYKEDYNIKNPSTTGPIIIRLSHVASEQTPVHKALEKAAQDIKEKSNGRVKLQLYPNAQLGGDRQNVEAVGLGSITATATGTGVLSGFEPIFTVTDLPFIFTSRESAYKAFDNELGNALNARLDKHNMVNLGFSETGFRQMSNNVRPITTPDDLKGIKMRTLENPIHMHSFKEWGSNPIPMSFSELFTALQQGTVDGQDNALQIFASARFFEVQKYLSLTEHFYASGSLLFNKDFYDNLPDDLREILTDAMTDFVKYTREIGVQADLDYLEQVKAAGVEVNELTSEQKQLFIDASKPVYDSFIVKYGEDLVNLATMYNN